MIKGNRLKRTGRILIAALALGGLGIAAPTPQPTHASGIRNCVDITGGQSGRVGCYENVWSGGVEYRMTFSNQGFAGSAPSVPARFYVLAPQGVAAQGPVSVFPHDHVIQDVPAGGASYQAKLAGFFVLCTAEGLISGNCVPMWMSPAGPALPFADTVAGGPLTSTGAIEAAAAAGHVVLVDLGPGAVIVGAINPGK